MSSPKKNNNLRSQRGGCIGNGSAKPRKSGGKKKPNDSEEKPKIGRKSWAEGPKLLLLLKHEALFYESQEKYYDVVEAEWTDTWGFNLTYKELPEEGKDYTPAPIESFPLEQQAAELKCRAGTSKSYREHITSWARNHFGQKKRDSDLTSEVLEVMTELMKVLPHRTSQLHMYQQMYYEDRVKEKFDVFWAQLVKAKLDSEWIREMNRFTARCLRDKEPEVKEKVLSSIQKEYDAAMEEYKNIGKWTSDAKKYRYNWKKAHLVIPPLADSLAKFFRVGVLVTMYGPMANGEISVQSVSSVIPDARTRLTLHQFNSDKLAQAHLMLGVPMAWLAPWLSSSGAEPDRAAHLNGSSQAI
ncbi:hypothetical protein Moror_15619 [Moniliophthora roreri MCA 2997]|uniref:Uncharacterized protein n=2 Tax=Moniliophthora roreri TaxID=221103 RepID=V2WS79_MONRO|nr:hypothetical protein Moror_15619 [Moniliophthora roreri MCA 2997]